MNDRSLNDLEVSRFDLFIISFRKVYHFGNLKKKLVISEIKKMIFLFWIFILTVEARDESDYPSYNLCKIFDEDMFAKMLPDMGLGMYIW